LKSGGFDQHIACQYGKSFIPNEADLDVRDRL